MNYLGACCWLTRRLYRLLRYLPPLVFGEIGILLLLPLLGWLHYVRAYYLIILTVDVAALVLIALIYIPVNVRMLRLETAPAMQIKQLATIALCLLYVLSVGLAFRRNVGAVLAGVMVVRHSKDVIVLLSVLCIILQFAPFKLLNWCLLPLAYGQYWRLLRLEQQVAHLTGVISRATPWVKPADLETARYTAVISILDNTPILPDDATGRRLRHHIERILHQHHDYPALAQALVEHQP